MGNQFKKPDFKTKNIMLLTKILNQQQFPKGTEHDGFHPITQDSLDGQAVVYIQTVDGNGLSNPQPFVYSVVVQFNCYVVQCLRPIAVSRLKAFYFVARNAVFVVT